ncbi:Zinc finger, RING/FYVE/PHD-type [Phytophthora cinnamomi]|uniref:Zinc finger, RING/FYVE/PHD-type n=1 Tax=Phytophthora cinnamomi TaxID=4785 RepID=UPI00355A6965|nr:Zinc finger, RING/FYVE/PHD-type [Phytophthora cinnamomi]
MKFPLAPDMMPTLQLPLGDQQCIERLASVFVNETIDQYMEHLQAARMQRSPRVCKKRWKQIKKRGNMTIYQDQHADESIRQKMSFRTLLETPGELAKTHVVMGLGHCEGLMEDAVYGSIAPTEEIMMVKTAYASDGVVDCRILSSIVTPSPIDPLRALQIKWCVNGSAPMIVSSMVRKRDFVYVESSGIVMTQSGERIGFNFLHSLEFKGVPDLSHLGLVRANLSICSLFRQREEGGVELFLQGFCDPLGDMAASVAILTTAEAILSYSGVVHCGRMKKLNWVLSKNSNIVYAQAPEVCCVCHKNQSSSVLPKKFCRICKGRVCHSCRKPRELCFVDVRSRKVRKYKLSFCKGCVNAAHHQRALEIAHDELMEENPMGAYEVDQESISSISSFRSSSQSDLRQFFAA